MAMDNLKMANRPPYDPVKSLEGMFNGSLVRIAYALKDPASFASSTKDILQETAKRFQDALDDCEIQILDAKWYLERQLAENKARRETKAKEESALNGKRKHEEMQKSSNDGNSKIEPEQPTAKRQKVEESKEPNATEVKKDARPQTPVRPETTPTGNETEKTQPSASKSTLKKADTTSPIQAQSKPPPTGPTVTKSDSKPPPETKPADLRVMSFDDNMGAKDKEEDNKDDFNFTSMFGEDGDGGMGDGDLGFDLDLDEDPFGDAINTGGGDTNQNMTAANNSNLNNDDLSSILPGLESYANQSNDDPNQFAMSLPENTSNNANAGTANFDSANVGTNDFDDFFNQTLGDVGGFGAVSAGGDGNLAANDDYTMNLDNIDNMDMMDFDSMFG